MPEDALHLLTVAEVASVLRVRRGRAYALLGSGLVPGLVRIGRQLRVDETALRAWIAGGGKSLRQDAQPGVPAKPPRRRQ